MNSWQLQEAKAHLSQVIKLAISNKPQEITLHGEPVAVVLSKEQYSHLTKPKESFVEFMENSPLKGSNITFERDKSVGRDVDL